MNEQESLFQKLRQQYTDEELAESFVFPHGLSKEEKKRADKELWEFRKKRLEDMTPGQRMYSGLLRIKYQIKAYTEKSEFEEEKSVAHFLREYLKVVNRKQKELAEDIDIHPTRINRIINGKEKISLAIAYRLEGHSGELLPAIFWWRLAQKEIEHEIRTDLKAKALEKKKVKKIAYKSAS